MGLDKYIESAIKGILKNPVVRVLREIGIARILRQSNFSKRDVGHSPYMILLHFIYMIIMNKRQSSYIKHSADAFGKDTYYRFLKQPRFNWRKLLSISAEALIRKVEPLQRSSEQKLLIIDDTVEPKYGAHIEGSCRYIWSNKEHKSVKGLNIVSLNYTDSYSTFQLDFSIRMNKSRYRETSEFTAKLHHRSNAYARRDEGLSGKNTLALEMVKRALKQGISRSNIVITTGGLGPTIDDITCQIIAKVLKKNLHRF